MLKELLTEPANEPVTLAEAKAHLVVDTDFNDDDPYITRLIKAARLHAEQRTNRVYVRQQWRLWMDYKFTEFKLLPAFVREVDQIQYIDADGATQTLATSVYTVDIPRRCVYLAYNQSWPAVRYQRSAIWADVWAGEYDETASPIDDTAGVPEDLKQAVLMIVADSYEHREAGMEITLHENKAVDAYLSRLVLDF